MSYTNVVFKQNITRNVNRDEVERQRLDDRGTFSHYSLVGFQARFQTAGNLIFKPEENSTLHVSCKNGLIQRNSDSIRTTTRMTETSER